MNPENENSTDALRSDIDTTRRRMDHTIDSLGERLQPRHLVDEVLGWFRGETEDGDTRMNQIREKVSRGANQAAQSVVQTVKANPLPALVIGAGVAWMIYESRRSKSGSNGDYRLGEYRGDRQYDPDLYADRPLSYPSGAGDQMNFENGGESKLDQLKDKASEVKDTVKEKVSALGEQTREKLSGVKERAGEKLQAAKQRAAELGSQAKAKAGAAYTATRDQVVRTADQHPLETGLACLAAGLIAGLLLPTPERVNRMAGPTAERLRQRARDAGTEALEKGKRVARAAADAVKTEAEAQGLTPDRRGRSAKAVAQKAGDAATDTAQQEGLGALTPAGQSEQSTGNFSGSSDPSSARPAV